MGNTDFNSDAILIVKLGVIIDSTNAISDVDRLRRHMAIELPDLVKGYFGNKYVSTEDIVNEVDKQCKLIIQNLYDDNLIAPLVDSQKCFEMVREYLTHVLTLKSKMNSVNPPSLDLVSELMDIFIGRTPAPFLNIKDLKSKLQKSVVPDNFVIWIDNKGEIKKCICYSEFDYTYKFLCVYR